MVAQDLTGQTDTSEPSSCEAFFFRFRHPGRFALDEFNPAGCATGKAAASVQYVDVGVLLDG